MSSCEYKSYIIKFKKDYVEISQNGNFLMTTDDINEAKKEINEIIKQKEELLLV